MDAAGARIDLRLQRIGIGVLELGELSPVEHPRGDLGTGRILVGGDPFEFGDVGRIDAGLALAAALDAHLLEQDVAQLLGAADRERRAGEAVDHRFEPGDLLAEPGGQGGQALAIDLDPAHFHPRTTGTSGRSTIS